jgi:hypothetical protein
MVTTAATEFQLAAGAIRIAVTIGRAGSTRSSHGKDERLERDRAVGKGDLLSIGPGDHVTGA